MPTITVRNLPETTRQALKERAARNNRSMEAEVRAILEETVTEGGRNWVEAWLEAAEEFRSEPGEPFELPERSMPRPVDLS